MPSQIIGATGIYNKKNPSSSDVIPAEVQNKQQSLSPFPTWHTLPYLLLQNFLPLTGQWKKKTVGFLESQEVNFSSNENL